MAFDQERTNPYSSPCADPGQAKHAQADFLLKLGWVVCVVNLLCVIVSPLFLAMTPGTGPAGWKVIVGWALLGVPISSLFFGLYERLGRRRGGGSKAQGLSHLIVMAGWLLLLVFVGIAFLLAG